MPGPSLSLPTLVGPYALSQHLVDDTVRGKVAGVFALSAKEGGAVNLRRIGRADDDLAAALREFIGLYSHFSCAAADSAESAYAMECRLHHAWTLPENPSHPTRPSESAEGCPVCGK